MSDLVKIVDGEGTLDKFITNDQFLEFINQEPPKAFIKNHPLANGVKYLPIDKVEIMLDKIFQEWRVEILSTKQLLNAISVDVRLHYKHPLNGWTFQDGTGGVAIQVEKGKNASDLGSIKSNAIMLGLPNAKSHAIKDAAEHIGKLFGRDLNRKDTIAFTPSYGTDEVKKEREEAKKKLLEKVSK